MPYPYVVPVPATPATGGGALQSPLDRVSTGVAVDAQLGFGLLRPFRRDEKNDFANAGGVALVRSCVGQVLGTMASSPEDPTIGGEVAWNPEFGSLIYLLRHMKNDDTLRELGRYYVIDALRRWEPRVIVKDCIVSREGTSAEGLNRLVIRIVYDFVTSVEEGNAVIFPDIDQTVAV